MQLQIKDNYVSNFAGKQYVLFTPKATVRRFLTIVSSRWTIQNKKWKTQTMLYYC